MNPFSYRTLASESSGTYREKGSKFLAFAYPVHSIEDVETALAGLRRRFHDARHHCYAWVLGTEEHSYRAFDDGEPNHSAGDPILGQIRARQLTNVLVVVVRYFGGVKLGVGGLVQAYKTAASEALDSNRILEKEVVARVILDYDYAATADVLRLVDEFELNIIEQTFTAGCHMKAEVPLRNRMVLIEKMSLLKTLGKDLTWTVSAQDDQGRRN